MKKPSEIWMERLAIAGGTFTLLFVGVAFWGLVLLRVALNGAPL